MKRMIKIIDENNNKKNILLYEDEKIYNLYLMAYDNDNNLIKVLDYNENELENEIWKSIKLLNKEKIKENEKILLNTSRNIYVSSLGRLMEIDDKNIANLIPIRIKNNDPYRNIRISGFDTRVHRLVGYLFIPNDDFINKPWIDHIDSNKKYDNRIENLHWVHPIQNSQNKINFDTSKCKSTNKEINNINTNRNKGPKVRLSIDGTRIIKIYENINDLKKEFDKNQLKTINRCCNDNLKENVNWHSSIDSIWMFYDHYIEYYSNKNNIISHQIKQSIPNKYDTDDIDINEIVKLELIDKNNVINSYNHLKLNQNQLNIEIWKLLKIPEDFKSDINGNSDKYNLLIKNLKVKRYYISNLGRIASYNKNDNKLILKSIIHINNYNHYVVSLFNVLYSLNQLIKICIKGEYIKK